MDPKPKDPTVLSKPTVDTTDREKVVIKSLRTYEGDMAEILRSQKGGSAVDIVMSEQAKKEQEKKKALEEIQAKTLHETELKKRREAEEALQKAANERREVREALEQAKKTRALEEAKKTTPPPILRPQAPLPPPTFHVQEEVAVQKKVFSQKPTETPVRVAAPVIIEKAVITPSPIQKERALEAPEKPSFRPEKETPPIVKPTPPQTSPQKKEVYVSPFTYPEKRLQPEPAFFPKPPEQPQNISFEIPEKKNRALLITSLVFIFLALVLSAGYFILKTKKNTPPNQRTTHSLLVVDLEKQISIQETDTQKLHTLLREAKGEGVWALSLTETHSVDKKTITAPAPVRTALTLLAPNIPNPLLRILKDTYLFGNDDTHSSPYIIFTTEAYDFAFAAMLGWEKTMPKDIGDIFSIPTTDTHFVDMVILNKDSRALVDRSGTLLFFYTFLDEKTIVITKNEGALETLLNRFAETKLTP